LSEDSRKVIERRGVIFSEELECPKCHNHEIEKVGKRAIDTIYKCRKCGFIISKTDPLWKLVNNLDILTRSIEEANLGRLS